MTVLRVNLHLHDLRLSSDLKLRSLFINASLLGVLST